MGNNQRKHDKHVSQQHDEVDVEKEKLEKRFLCRHLANKRGKMKMAQCRLNMRIRASRKNLLPTEQPGAALTKQIFQEKLLSACVAYSNALFDYIATQNASGSQEQLTLQMKDYVKTGKDIMRLMNFPQQTAFFFKLFSNHKGSLNREEGLLMLHTCCTLAYYCAGVTSLNLATDDLFLVAMWNSLRGGEEVVPVETATSWCSRHCPGIWDAIHLCTRLALFGGHSIGQEGAAPNPTLLQTLESGEYLLSLPMLWVLSTILPSVYIPPSQVTGDQGKSAFGSHLPLSNIVAGTSFHLMYSSNEHGLSTNRFSHHVFSYNAPTLLLISFDGHVYCVAVDSEWREGVQRWGGADCCLVQLLPVFKSLQTGSGMLYLNTQDRRMPKQLQVGTDVKRLPLQVDAGFSSVKHHGVDVPLERLEMWGCGGQSVLKEQLSQKQWEQKEADKQKNRKLKLEDWADNPDRELLNMGGITTEHAER